MNLVALKTEITTDPQALGYAGKTDEQIAALLNTPTRQANRESITPGQLVASLVRSEVNALSAADKQYVQIVAGAGGDIPLSANFKTELSAVFAAGTVTRANLINLQKRTGSRAEELDLGGSVTPSDIADARRLP